MILPKPEDVFHKIQLNRLLMAILDCKELAQNVHFKGGSCATMLGWLDRFSVDLDFDLKPKVDRELIRHKLIKIFKTLNLEIKNENKKALQYIVQYSAKPGLRNMIKLGFLEKSIKANDYQLFYLPEIDRYAICQTKETMVANKLVAPLDRFEKYKMIAGRDIYDIHYFLSHGYGYKKEVIEERREIIPKKYLNQLKEFIKIKVNNKIINEDLNYLLPYDKFKVIRKTLKTEVLMLINEEIRRW